MDLHTSRKTDRMLKEERAFRVDYEKEVHAPPGELLDMKSTKIDERTWAHFVELECPNCGVTGAIKPWGIVHDEEGQKAIGECQNCRQKIASYHKISPVFSWCFDYQAHEIWWDVTDMLQLVAKHRHACPEVELHAELVKALFEMNCENAVENPDYAMSRDLNEPILIISHPSPLAHSEFVKVDFPPILPVDGWHRLYKAAKLGLPVKALLVHPAIVEKCVVKEVIYAGYTGADTGATGN